MNIAVTGHKGKLGSYLANNYGLTPLDVDVRDQQGLTDWFIYNQPEVVINCAAKSLVDFSQTNYKEACEVNYKGVSNLIRASIRSDINPKIIQLSTDYIFPCDGGPYGDTDPVKLAGALNVYGYLKLAAELTLSTIYHNYVIARVTGLFGAMNGTKDLIQQFLERVILSEEEMLLSNELHGNPTYIPYLSEFLVGAALDKSFTGQTVHIAPSLVVSRYEFIVRYVIPILGFPDYYSELCIPCKNSDVGWISKRPTRGGLIPSHGFSINKSLETALISYASYLKLEMYPE